MAAKVVTNAKTPGARCYGFVTMATIEDAQKCITGLNLTELHGRLISVEAVCIYSIHTFKIYVIISIKNSNTYYVDYIIWLI